MKFILVSTTLATLALLATAAPLPKPAVLVEAEPTTPSVPKNETRWDWEDPCAFIPRLNATFYPLNATSFEEEKVELLFRFNLLKEVSLPLLTHRSLHPIPQSFKTSSLTSFPRLRRNLRLSVMTLLSLRSTTSLRSF
jgi:hypothetical protein